MHMPSAMKTTYPALLFAALIGCGSSGNGTMNVHLVDATGPYARVDLQVKRLDIHGPQGWQTLADFSSLAGGVKEVDLLSLTGGVEETLAQGASLPVGHYDQMRLLLGAGNTVTLSGPPVTTVPLKVPSGMQSGVKFPVSFDVAENTTKDVFIDFDAHRSIFVHAAGNSGQYLLRPVVRAVDRIVTGAITGTLTDGLSGAAGVIVTAQILDEAGKPTIVNHATTNADGSYVIGLLPVGLSYHVVTEAIAGTSSAYTPTASEPISVTMTAPVQTYGRSLTRAQAHQLSGNVVGTPLLTTSEATDEVSAHQTLQAGGSLQSHDFIVAWAGATVDTAGEHYSLGSLASGIYSLLVTRSTPDSDGGQTLLTTITPTIADITLSDVAANVSFP
jgi:Domain of unknown function (DUF4382)